jgi:4-amino-4-deoxy-L-arabinose transferase-like glycosyltransferase
MRSHLTTLLLALFAVFGVLYARAVPLGEAPDEPAHVAYIDHLVATHHLPALPGAFDHTNYESFQPPLAYLVSAIGVAAFHGAPLAVPWVPNPCFDQRREASRAFAPVAAEAGASLFRLRLAHLGWGLLGAFLVLKIAQALGADWRRMAIGAAPFVLAPQLLFVAATVNNDGPLMAISTAALYGLTLLLLADQPSAGLAVAAGVAGGAAALCKPSGVVLAVAVGAAALALMRRRQFRALLSLILAYGAVFAGALALNVVRFGSLTTTLPPGQPATLGQLLGSPHWLGGIWISSWAKFGWLDVRLPWPAYFLFLAPTALAGVGILAGSGRRAGGDVDVLWMLRATVGFNLALAVFYNLTVDRQAQGRYLFPSIAASAALAVCGAERLRWRDPWLATAAITSLGLVAVAALAGWFTLLAAYAPGLPPCPGR